MRRLLSLVFLLLASVIWGNAQATPVPIGVPTMYGPNGSRFYTAVDKATAHGWKAISFEVGVTFMTDPAKVDLTKLANGIHYAFTKGVTYVVLRVGQDVQPFQYSGGQPIGLTYWGKLMGLSLADVSAYQKYRPREQAWAPLGELWRKILEAFAKQLAADGICGAAVLTNESCMGGAGDGRIGSSSSATYPPPFNTYPQGYIEPGFWKMLRAIIAATGFELNGWYGLRVYYMSHEGDISSVGITEAQSCVGDDYQAVLAACVGPDPTNPRGGFAVNAYAPKAFDRWSDTYKKYINYTPVEVAKAWVTETNKRAARLRQYAGSAARVAVMEANVMEGRLSSTATTDGRGKLLFSDGKPQRAHTPDYRKAFIATAQVQAFDFVGIFVFYGFAGCQYVDANWNPVYGVWVGPSQ